MSRLIFVLFVATASLLQAQETASGVVYQPHGIVTRKDGVTNITGSSPRPVEQGMSVIRREYGLVLDYEEGSSDDPSQVVGMGFSKRWIGGSYVVRLPETGGSEVNQRVQFIENLLTQFRSQGSRDFTVIPGANGRLTVAPSTPSGRVLDTPIILKAEKRSISQTIEAIMAEVSKKRGVSIERGGLIDNDLENGIVEVGASTPISARTLLAQSLDRAQERKFWLFGWEPSSGSYAILIQTAVKLQRMPTGEVGEIPVR